MCLLILLPLLYSKLHEGSHLYSPATWVHSKCLLSDEDSGQLCVYGGAKDAWQEKGVRGDNSKSKGYHPHENSLGC